MSVGFNEIYVNDEPLIMKILNDDDVDSFEVWMKIQMERNGWLANFSLNGLSGLEREMAIKAASKKIRNYKVSEDEMAECEVFRAAFLLGSIKCFGFLASYRNLNILHERSEDGRSLPLIENRFFSTITRNGEKESGELCILEEVLKEIMIMSWEKSIDWLKLFPMVYLSELAEKELLTGKCLLYIRKPTEIVISLVRLGAINTDKAMELVKGLGHYCSSNTISEIENFELSKNITVKSNHKSLSL